MSKILICGAGSIGIYLGTLLHAKKHDVTLFGKRKLQNLGEQLFINDHIYRVPHRVFILPKNKEYDFIFITAKLYNLTEIIELIQKNEIKTKILISIQNGLVDNTLYEKILQGQKLIILSVFEGFRVLDNQLIMTPTEMGWKIEDSPSGRAASKILLDAGILCKPEPKLDSFRAEKSIVNCCLNALSAIERKTFDELFSTERIRKRIDRIFDECYAIVCKEYELDESEVVKSRMYRVWSQMRHYSSTCQDMVSGRITEIDFLNGYMIKLGKKYHLSVIENEKIMQDFKRIKS